MPLQKIGFSVHGEDQYVRGFEATAEELRDLSEPLSNIGKMLRHDVAEQFLTEGAAGLHGRWRQLNPSYERWKREQGYDGPILVREGDMLRAATDKRSVTVTPQRMIYEIDDPKAAYHQDGSGHLPQRRLVDLSPVQKRAWDREFASWLNRIRRGPLGVI